MKTLFLQAPSIEGFDGGAGSRYQAKREIRSFWYPTWLAQPAALVPGSRLIDAPAAGLSAETVLAAAADYELVILHTSTPSFAADVRFAEELRRRRPDVVIGMVGAAVSVDPVGSLETAAAVDFCCGEEFDFTCKELADGLPLEQVRGLAYRAEDGGIVRNPTRPLLDDMDRLPFVSPVYRDNLPMEKYFIGYLKHPYISLYTGRGCRSRCTFCLWPQTVGGHRYRVRSARHVLEEVEWIRDHLPEVKEIMFDDDTFTDLRQRAEEIAVGMGRLGVTWSCNAKPNVPYSTLKVMKENGLRLLLVGYESGDEKILRTVKKGVLVDQIRQFSRDCRELGIRVHGTFILGLPGETRETIDATIEFARQINPQTIQVSLASPYPGTKLYEQAVENGWLDKADLISADGVQIAALSYPHLDRTEIHRGVERFYRAFYMRPSKIFELGREMLRSWQTTKRQLREGFEMLRFLRNRRA
jgi:hopanoid biosynthesis associated radical SAM protein HpnJ